MLLEPKGFQAGNLGWKMREVFWREMETQRVPAMLQANLPTVSMGD